MKIVADENIPCVRDAFASLGNVQTVSGRALSAADVTDAEVLLVRSVTQVDEALLRGTAVRFVASATAGVNHVDLDYLAANHIHFANAPGSNAISAAEYVIAGISYWSLRNGIPLAGLSIGIVGCGNVGSRVQQRCEKLGMRCVLNDPPLADQGVGGLQSLQAALACDIVTLHVPLVTTGPHPTLGMLDAQCVESMQPGTLFINAARGDVVDEAALLARMKRSGDLSLVLDVWENEPDIDLEMLRHCLLGTAHIAGYSIDGKIRGTEMIYDACCKYLQVAPQWSAADVDFPVAQTLVELSESNDQVRQQILQAYDIEADSRRLGKLLVDDSLKRGEYFDALRKNYPVRREFTLEQ
jgi:erythronate-4-phosphate dehydrogenase